MEMNSLVGCGWLEFKDGKFVFKGDYYMNSRGREKMITSNKYSESILVDGKRVRGSVMFQGVNEVFEEPVNGWTLANFISAITESQNKWRLMEENYFLEGVDYHHVIFAGIEKKDGVYVIEWDS